MNEKPPVPGIQSYRDLVVWKKAMELAVHCYSLTRSFAAAEQFGLTSQIRRSSSAIAANVAEGQGRETSGAFVQVLRVSQGSLKELETHLLLANRVELLGDEACNDVLRRCDELGRILRGLIRAVQAKAGC